MPTPPIVPPPPAARFIPLLALRLNGKSMLPPLELRVSEAVPKLIALVSVISTAALLWAPVLTETELGALLKLIVSVLACVAAVPLIIWLNARVETP